MTTAFKAFPPVLIILALTVMVLPTWRTTWLGPTVDSVHVVEFRWFALIVLGYGNPFPLLCLGSTVLALVIALARLANGPGERNSRRGAGRGVGGGRGAGGGRGVGGGRGIVLEVVLGVGIVAAACGEVIFDGLHGWAFAAPALLLLCLLVLLLPRLVARVDLSRAADARPGSPPPGSPPLGSTREEINPGTDPGPTRGR